MSLGTSCAQKCWALLVLVSLFFVCSNKVFEDWIDIDWTDTWFLGTIPISMKHEYFLFELVLWSWIYSNVSEPVDDGIKELHVPYKMSKLVASVKSWESFEIGQGNCKNSYYCCLVVKMKQLCIWRKDQWTTDLRKIK